MLYGYSMGNMNIIKLIESSHGDINNIIILLETALRELLPS